jgi:hypothetical protein
MKDREGNRLHHDKRLVDIAGFVRVETGLAFLFFDGTRQVWLPKSQVEWDPSERVMTMPEWLGRDKGLL